MKGFHVTFYENLDSILTTGLEPRNTTKNNFPMANDNDEERLFFMIDFHASYWWFRTHHPVDYVWDENYYQHEVERKDSVIIEFEINGVFCYPDPYQCDGGDMESAFFINAKIPPENILNIHSPYEIEI